MKKILQLLILPCLLISSGLIAQNYQTVNSGRISYFTTSGEDFQFLRIDSTSFNGDSVFYPNRCLNYLNYMGHECYSPYQPSWAGSRVVVHPDGANVYFNRENDSIVIKTKVKFGESWIVYQKNDSISVIAEVVVFDTASVLGQLDSVKTIQFHVLNSSGEKMDHRLNNLEVSISQNFGWTKTINFNSFPNFSGKSEIFRDFVSGTLVGIDNPRLGIQNLTWWEVFDFQPGDIIHTQNRSVRCGVSDTTRIQKVINIYLDRKDYTDSIVYIVNPKLRETITIDDVSTFSFLNDTVKSKIILFNLELDKLSGEPIITDDKKNCLIHYQCNSNGQISKEFYQFGLPMVKTDDECWEMISYAGIGRLSYIKGLGKYYYYSLGPCHEEELSLVFYKKGKITWGTPFDFTGVETLANLNYMKVYPNPASDKICVETVSYNDPVTFELYSSGGSLVLRQIIYSEKQDVDVSSFENGIYFYNVSTADQILKNGKITILH
jgi:hypothetical protein